MKLLSLSNGHGEDAIALRILQQVQQQAAERQVAIELAALPIVGAGQGYRQQGIAIAGPVQEMPSGGFIYMDGKQLMRDLRGGLLPLTWAQLQTVRAWAQSGGMILGVGDIVPLLFAWWSGAPYAFVGTAQSEYYLRDDQGQPLPQLTGRDRLAIALGSVYLPWERWLMRQSRCQAVFPRDPLTTAILQQQGISAFDLGNPMMDGLAPTQTLESDRSRVTDALFSCLLLPGSRAPEAHENWQLILQTVANLLEMFGNKPLVFLTAIAANLEIQPFCQILVAKGWQQQFPEALTFYQGNATLSLTTSAFNDYAHQATFAIAMAGTATEQVVGLGKPVVTLPGKGPQFTPAFAAAQTRLLGASILFVHHPDQVPAVVRSLLEDPDRLEQIAENGLRRMGKAGAAQRIASQLLTVFR